MAKISRSPETGTTSVFQLCSYKNNLINSIDFLSLFGASISAKYDLTDFTGIENTDASRDIPFLRARTDSQP